MDDGDWMVPKLSLSAEAQLHSTLKTLDEHGAKEIEATVRMAKALAQQTVIQQAIIRQAVGHISRLELASLLADTQPLRRRPWWRMW